MTDESAPVVPTVPTGSAAPVEPPFRVGAATHVGMIRTMNEDAYVVRDHVVAVADGMGGHLSGEVASAMAIEALAALDGTVTVNSVVGAVLDANDRILQLSRADASHRGMGTTLTALAVVEPHEGAGRNRRELAVVNLGDSRTYRFRDGELEQVTIDHSYVQELVAGGHLSPDEARFHPQRNIVTRALGIEPNVGVDVWNIPVVRGDRFLLCSDGLVDEVSDHTIATVLREVDDPQDAADQLVDLANRSGGRDNVTVVVVDVVTESESLVDETPTMPLPVIEADMEPPRELDETLEEPTPVGVHSSATPSESLATPSERIDTESAARARSEEAPAEGAAEGAAESATATPPTSTTPATPTAPRRLNLRRLAIFGGLAVLAGVVLVLLTRDDGSEPAPTTTTTSTVATTTPPTTIPPTTAPTTTRPAATIGTVPTTAATPATAPPASTP